MFYKKKSCYYDTYHQTNQKDRDFSLDKGMSEGLGIDEIEVYWSIDIDITTLVGGISCLYKCVLVSYGGYVVS